MGKGDGRRTSGGGASVCTNGQSPQHPLDNEYFLYVHPPPSSLLLFTVTSLYFFFPKARGLSGKRVGLEGSRVPRTYEQQGVRRGGDVDGRAAVGVYFWSSSQPGSANMFRNTATRPAVLSFSSRGNDVEPSLQLMGGKKTPENVFPAVNSKLAA